MIILDFLFYHLVYYFEKNPRLLTWSNPIERSAYAIGLATMALIFSANELLVFKHVFSNDMPKWLLLLLALGVMCLYQYIYLNRKRYALISSPNYYNFTIKKNTGVIITIAFIFLSIMSPFVVISITVP